MTGRRITAAELDTRIAVIDALVRQLVAQVDAHQVWHRDMLVRAGESGSSRRLAVLALLISGIAAIAAVLLALATLIR